MNQVNDSDSNKQEIESRLKDELKKNLLHYRNVVNYLSANVPIQVLCLPKKIEKILLREGYIRVYDLIGLDFTKIKGIGEASASIIESRFDDFFVVSL